MFDKLLKKRIEQEMNRRGMVRECVYCAYESEVATRCPKCKGYSFVTYIKMPEMAVA